MNFDTITDALAIAAKILLSPAYIKNGDYGIEGPVVIILPVTIAILLLSAWSFFWLFRDARKRDKNGLVAIIFILITGWPLSFVWWLWLRPANIKSQ